MAKKRETTFKEKIRPLLGELPRSWFFKTQMIAVRGIPDFVGCVNGHFIALELKKDDTSRLDALQEWVLNKIIRSGGLGLRVSPENWEQTYTMLMDIANGNATYQIELPPAPALSS